MDKVESDNVYINDTKTNDDSDANNVIDVHTNISGGNDANSINSVSVGCDTDSGSQASPSTGKGKRFDVNEYVNLQCIGQGNFSEVYMVEHVDTKILYSMKMFTKQRVDQLKKQCDVLMEKHVMEKITEHRNIIKYYGSNKDEMFLYILYEYVNGGEIWKRSKVYGIPSVELIKYYFDQVLEGIEHMHSFNIVHRDIKPENIMITKDNLTVKIIDFGSCKDMEGTNFERQFDELEAKQNATGARRRSTFKNFVGTAQYMAPECVRNKGSSFASDCYSLGCLLFQLFVGFPLYLGKTDYLVFVESTEAKYVIPSGIIDKQAEDLIRSLIKVDPRQRLSLSQIRNHEFMAGYTKKPRKQYPVFKLSEYALLSLRKSLTSFCDQYRDLLVTYDKLKKEDDQQKYNEQFGSSEKLEKTEDEKTEEALKLIKYEEAKKGYSEALELINIKFEEIFKITNENQMISKEDTDVLLLKLIHLKKQVLYDYFNIQMTFN